MQRSLTKRGQKGKGLRPVGKRSGRARSALLNRQQERHLEQHAIFTIPNRREGYTTDDNARALTLAVLLEPLERDLPMSEQALWLAIAVYRDHDSRYRSDVDKANLSEAIAASRM